MNKRMTAAAVTAVLALSLLTACGEDDDECEGAGSVGVTDMSMVTGNTGGSSGGKKGSGSNSGGSKQENGKKPPKGSTSAGVGAAAGVGLHVDDDDCDD